MCSQSSPFSIKKLETQLKNLTDAEKVTRFEKASEEISREILEGKLTGKQLRK